MKFKILIDKSTIKENPAAGSTELVESLPPKTIFKIDGIKLVSPDYDYDSQLKFIAEYTKHLGFAVINGRFSITTIPLDKGDAYIVQDWIERNKDMIENVTIETKANLVKHKTMPQPRYSFEYEPMFVECGSCGAKFNHMYLKEEYEYDNAYSNVCPACGEYECCEVEYQDIEEALKERVV
jgi:uncharacterized protein YlzI (FlbEa/FlbD family)